MKLIIFYKGICIFFDKLYNVIFTYLDIYTLEDLHLWTFKMLILVFIILVFSYLIFLNIFGLSIICSI